MIHASVRGSDVVTPDVYEYVTVFRLQTGTKSNEGYLSLTGRSWVMASVAIEIHDEEAWDAMPEVQKQDYISTAMTLGKVEVHKRWPIATLTRMNGRDRVPQWKDFHEQTTEE